MDKNDLLFYNAYEDFYKMAARSKAFSAFCRDAFGSDFSQDGFSDISQIDLILKYIPPAEKTHILDVGCGNGKMLGYLQRKTGAFIHGFDFSEYAIKTASSLYTVNSDFKEGIIGKIQYPSDTFDAVISMDTVYFAKNMAAFVADVKKWMKPDAVFIVGYQEGDIMPRTGCIEETAIAEAFSESGMPYESVDITHDTYNLLKRKRKAAIAHKSEFEAENNMRWFDLLMCQTECINCDYDEFREHMSRYIFIAHKPVCSLNSRRI